MKQGTVKWYNVDKGYGFIQQEGDEDVFVHKSEVEGSLHEGQKVEFEIGTGKKGPCAVQVKPL